MTTRISLWRISSPEKQTQPRGIGRAYFNSDLRPRAGTFSSRLAQALREIPRSTRLRIYAGSDFAVTVKGDYTAFGDCRLSGDRSLWLLDVWRKQTTPTFGASNCFGCEALALQFSGRKRKASSRITIEPLISATARERAHISRASSSHRRKTRLLWRRQYAATSHE